MRERVKVNTLAEVKEAYNKIYARAEYGDKEVLYKKVYQRLAPEVPDRVLDIACGAGQWLRFLEDRDHLTAGCELSELALKRARNRCPDSWLFQADGAKLPLKDASWRYVTCLGSLEHFLDPGEGARELRRILTPDGLAIVMLPNSYYSGDIWRVIRGGYGPDHHQIIDRFATVAEWRDLLESAGLEVLHTDRYDKGKLWKRLLFPFNLAYHFVFTCRRAKP
jgi:ubiquinone/menaquinone biosynthesis C-methylase UbiE